MATKPKAAKSRKKPFLSGAELPSQKPQVGSYKINDERKIELDLGKDLYKSLPDDLKKDIKGYFLFSRPRQAWVSKGTASSWGVRRILEKLNPVFTGKDDRISFADKMVRKDERAENRTVRLEKKSESAQKRAESLQSEFNRLRKDWSWLTQPIIRGHAGSERFGRQKARVVGDYERGFEEYRKSEQYQRRIESISDQKEELKDVRFLSRRIKDAKAVIAKYEKTIPQALERLEQKDEGAQKDEFKERISNAMERLQEAYEKEAFYSALLEQVGGGQYFTKESFAGVTYFRERNIWHKVIKRNPKSVRHSYGFDGEANTKYENVREVVFAWDAYTVSSYGTHVKETGNYAITDIQRGVEPGQKEPKATKDKSAFTPKSRGRKPVKTATKKMTQSQIKAAYEQINLALLPDQIRRELKEIAQATEDFSDTDLVDVFAENFADLYRIVQTRHPDALLGGEMEYKWESKRQVFISLTPNGYPVTGQGRITSRREGSDGAIKYKVTDSDGRKLDLYEYQITGYVTGAKPETAGKTVSPKKAKPAASAKAWPILTVSSLLFQQNGAKGVFVVIVPRELDMKDLEVGEDAVVAGTASGMKKMVAAFKTTGLDPKKYKIMQVSGANGRTPYGYEYPFGADDYYDHTGFETVRKPGKAKPANAPKYRKGQMVYVYASDDSTPNQFNNLPATILRFEGINDQGEWFYSISFTQKGKQTIQTIAESHISNHQMEQLEQYEGYKLGQRVAVRDGDEVVISEIVAIENHNGKGFFWFERRNGQQDMVRTTKDFVSPNGQAKSAKRDSFTAKSRGKKPVTVILPTLTNGQAKSLKRLTFTGKSRGKKPEPAQAKPKYSIGQWVTASVTVRFVPTQKREDLPVQVTGFDEKNDIGQWLYRISYTHKGKQLTRTISEDKIIQTITAPVALSPVKSPKAKPATKPKATTEYRSATIIHFYSDTPIGTRGGIEKTWIDKFGNQWYKLFFGRNKGGQKLAKSYPSDVLELSTDIFDHTLPRPHGGLPMPAVVPEPTAAKPVKSVERVTPETEFLRSFVSSNGRIKSFNAGRLLLSRLQKAIKERIIRKTSPVATEILYMQGRLLEVLRAAEKDNKDFVKITIPDDKLPRLVALAGGERVYGSIPLLKAYINMQATKPDGKRAASLLKRMENADLSADPYAAKVSELARNLKRYLADTQKPLPIEQSDLSGLMTGMLAGVQAKPRANGRISAHDLGQAAHASYPFSGRYAQLLGKPATNFRLMIYGQPGVGKSTEAMRLARYLAQKHGRVLYVSSEEHGSSTQAAKLALVGGAVAGWDFDREVPQDVGAYSFLVIDSVNRSGFALETFRSLCDKYPDLSMILIFQTTKSGQFKGEKDWEHDCDIVVQGIAHGLLETTKNRYAPLAQVQVF